MPDPYPGLDATKITEILESVLYTQPWDNASSADQTKALNVAVQAIERLNFVGSKADSDQTYQFPRGTDTDVPDDIHRAIVHEAINLLDGVNPQFEYENLGTVSQGYAETRTKHDYRNTRDNILAGITSVYAWRYLIPYLRDHHTIELYRT